MKKIEETDKNFAVDGRAIRGGMCFYDVLQEPFRIYGVFMENGKFRRMPGKVAEQVSEGVYNLHTNTAGGRVRFVTDSLYVAIRTEYTPSWMPHFAYSGSGGFDMYAAVGNHTQYAGTFVPPLDAVSGYEGVIDFADRREREVTIHFPLYSDVRKLWIGLEEGAVLKETSGYGRKKKIVYYGSSITQGGCASRPGSCYPAILSRRFDCDHVNLGFSGNAKGEDEMADYIGSLAMDVFVYDYDHNAPSVAHLKGTHRRMFCRIREKHPDLPVIILSRPKYYLNEEEQERRQIIYDTYRLAREGGDRNVFFIGGEKLMELVEDEGTVDNCHPTDSGFFSMAHAVGTVLEKIL